MACQRPSFVPVDVFRPGDQNWDFALTYTSFAMYETHDVMGVVAFGLATPASAMPASGSATYQAFVAGQGEYLEGTVRGNASLQFDFGAGTLSGHFDPVLSDFFSGTTPLGHFDFVNTVYSAGSTTFSGELSSTAFATPGSFDGQFTGPAAQELMAHFSAPFGDPAHPSTMFGVWVGKK